MHVYDSYGDALPPAEVVAALKARVQTANNELWAALGRRGKVSSFIADWKPQVEAWHSAAVYWMNLAPRAMENPSTMESWRQSGLKALTGARDMLNRMGETAAGRVIGSAITGVPTTLWKGAGNAANLGKGALISIGTGVTDITTSLAKGASGTAQELGKGAGKTLLWVGGAALLILWGLQKTGTKINLPFFSTGGR